MESTESELHAVNSQYQKESVKRIEFEEQLKAVEIRLTDKDTHIQSLEEKHKHAREALEHFRQSSKDQRD